MVSNRAVIQVEILIWMHVKKVCSLVGLNGAFQEEDQKSTCPANLQVIWQQVSNSFVDKGLGNNIFRRTRLQAISTKLHTKLDSINTSLKTIK